MSGALLALLLGLATIAGAVSGYVLGCRQMPRMIARMSPEQIDALGAEVAKVKGLDDGAG